MIKLNHLNNRFIKLISNQFLIQPMRSQTNFTQGQYAKEGSQKREYFYEITDEGYLFLVDTKHKNFTSAFKDKEFLKFFFDRLQINNTDRYADEFNYLSRCGYEINYIKVSDVPIVYTHLIDDLISYNYGGHLLATQFEPQHICMCPKSGRVYYPTIPKYGQLGLVRSKLSIELSKHFIFDKLKNKSNDQFDEPVAINWNNKTYALSYQLKSILIKRTKQLND